MFGRFSIKLKAESRGAEEQFRKRDRYVKPAKKPERKSRESPKRKRNREYESGGELAATVSMM